MSKAQQNTIKDVFNNIKNIINNTNTIIDKNNNNLPSEVFGCFIFNKQGSDYIIPIYKPEYGVVDQIVSKIEINDDSSLTISDEVFGKIYFNYENFNEFKNHFNKNQKDYFFYDSEIIKDFYMKDTTDDKNIIWDMRNIPESVQWSIFK